MSNFNRFKELKMEESVKQKIESWLSGPYDSDTKERIQSLVDSGRTDELTDAFYRDLEFGTGGLRGVMGDGSNRMNKYTVGQATQGLANYLQITFSKSASCVV